MQTVLADVEIHLVPWSWTAKRPMDFERDRFAFFDETEHYAECDAVNELAALANSQPDLPIGDLGKMSGGLKFERAFQRKAVELLRKHNPRLREEVILVPTQPMLRRAAGPGSSGRYMPHVDFDVRLGSHDLVAPWWAKSWGRYILGSEHVREALEEVGSLDAGAAPDPARFTAQAFSEVFDLVGIQTVWVSLNSAPCDNNQLALCSWASVDPGTDLKEYQIFGPGITAIGLHPNDDQLWVAPATLRFGQGVRFDALAAPHVAVAREQGGFQSAAARLSVECRVLMLRKKREREPRWCETSVSRTHLELDHV